MARYWGRTQATKELAYSIFQRSAATEIKDKLNNFLGSNKIQNEIKKELDRLSTGKSNLEFTYNELYKALIKEGYFDQGSILEDIMDILSTNGAVEYRENLLNQFFNTNMLSSSLENKINDYFYNYESMYNNVLNASDTVQKIMDQIRGDTSLYALGTAQTVSLMTASAYTSLERNNRNLFELSFRENKQGEYTLNQLRAKKGIENADLLKSISNLAKDPIYSNKIIFNLLDYKVGENTNITYRTVWNELQATTIQAKQQDKVLGEGRKLEFLLSGEFMNVNTISDIKEVINNNQGKRSISENIFGFATGDINVDSSFGKFGIQTKYSNEKMPWNGTSVNGLINSLSLLSNKDNLIQNTIYHTINNVSDLNTANDFFKIVYGSSFDKVGWKAQEYIYQEIEGAFSDAFNNNPLFYSYLASQQFQDLEEDIFEDYTETYSEETDTAIEDGDYSEW